MLYLVILIWLLHSDPYYNNQHFNIKKKKKFMSLVINQNSNVVLDLKNGDKNL